MTLDYADRSDSPVSDDGEDETARFFRDLYQELHTLARSYMRRQAPGHTLQPTALVGEAYMRLSRLDPGRWSSRAHFMAVAARAMRSVLVDHARGRGRKKRRAEGRRISLEGLCALFERDVDIEHLDAGLRDLEARGHERCVRVIELRFFCGLTMAQVAEALDCGQRTVERDWRFATAHLRRWFG